MASVREWRALGVGVGLALGAVVFLGACASGDEAGVRPGVTIPAGSYGEAFQAAKDALRASHFDLERVDAAAGVITTLPRSSAGLATPWIGHAGTPGESVDDLLHRDRRRATVLFGPADHPDASPMVDRRSLGAPLAVRVIVEVERTYVPGRRADATSIRLSSRVLDPQLAERGLHPLARGEVGHDEELAARIAGMIADSIRPAPGS